MKGHHITTPKYTITDPAEFNAPQAVLSPKKNLEDEFKSDDKMTEEEKKEKIQKAVMMLKFHFICNYLQKIKLKI